MEVPKMNYRTLSAGVLAATLAGIGGAAAQTAYIESYAPPPVYVEPAPTYVGPASTYVAPSYVAPSYVAPANGYVVEQRVVPSYPAVTYERRVVAPPWVEQRVVAPPVERRVIRTIDNGATTYVTETDGSAASCGYDSFGRMICD
jgi:hypothetical protein